MLLISAVYDKENRGYRQMAENMKKSAQAVGYDVVIRELNDDPMDSVKSPHDYRVNCFFKPHVILDALRSTDQDIAWVDGDCLIRERFDEILDNCDAAVTLRRFDVGRRDEYDGYINAGVMAFRNNELTVRLIQKWIEEQPYGRADQDALNRVLLRYSAMNSFWEIVSVDGCLVKMAPCDLYNFFYFPEDPGAAKILHIKGSLRPAFYDHYVRQACLMS